LLKYGDKAVAKLVKIISSTRRHFIINYLLYYSPI